MVGTGADQLLVQLELLCDRIRGDEHFCLGCGMRLWSRMCQCRLGWNRGCVGVAVREPSWGNRAALHAWDILVGGYL